MYTYVMYYNIKKSGFKRFPHLFLFIYPMFSYVLYYNIENSGFNAVSTYLL